MRLDHRERYSRDGAVALKAVTHQLIHIGLAVCIWRRQGKASQSQTDAGVEEETENWRGG